MNVSYRRALDWIIEHEDVDFLTEPDPSPPATVSLVADLFGKTDAIVMRDLGRRVSR